MDWQNPFTFYQLMAWPPLFLYIASYQVLAPRKTIMLWIPASLFMAVHFYGMGATPALCIVLGSIIRDGVAIFGSRRALLITTLLYVVYAWGAIILFADNIQGYLMGIGTIFLSLATFFRDHFWRHRSFSMCNQGMWLLAFILMGSYGGIAQNILIIASNIIGMIRHSKSTQK